MCSPGNKHRTLASSSVPNTQRRVMLVSPRQSLTTYCWCRHCSYSQCTAGVAMAVTRKVLLVSPLQSFVMHCWCRHGSHSQRTAGVATAVTRNVLLVSPLQSLAMSSVRSTSTGPLSVCLSVRQFTFCLDCLTLEEWTRQAVLHRR